MTVMTETRSKYGTMQSRLQQLVKEYSLSGLARHIDIPVSTLHRYAANGKMPADLVAMLAEKLSVNPRWFLLGEGLTYQTDVKQGGDNLAIEFRGLMEAMTAASRMKLGALSRRKGLGLLRDLADTAIHDQHTKDQLKQGLRPVAQEWLKSFRSALANRNHNQASDLHDALKKLLSFTDDIDLHRAFDRYRAWHASIEGRRADAVDIQRRNLLVRLAESGQIDETTLREAYNLGIALSVLGRLDEAYRFTKAVLILRGEDQPSIHIEAMLRGSLGLYEILIGDVSKGVELIVSVYSARQNPEDTHLPLLFGMAMMRSGSMSLPAILKECAGGIDLVTETMYAAVCREQVEELQAVLDYIQESTKLTLQATNLVGAHAEFMLLALKGSRRLPKESTFEVLETRQALTPIAGEIDVAILRCQRARLAKRQDAAKFALQAEELISRVPPEITLDALILANHARNVIALAPRRPKLKAMALKAEDYLASLDRRGLRFLSRF